jgi:hypothetical protein
MINRTTGDQVNCDKFGSLPSSFKPYSTGFQSQRPQNIIEADHNYRVQPKKFDGYFQCPRPSSHISEVRRPYTSTTKKYIPKRLSDDIKKLPRPVASLSFSKVFEGQSTPPQMTRAHKSSLPESEALTIETIKSSMRESPIREIKTAKQILDHNHQEKEKAKGYQAPAFKVKRRKLKGFFMVDFPTDHDLVKKEKNLLEKTNPVAVEKQRKLEAAEYKNLERRRAQKVLKNKLIEGRG